MKVSRLLPFAGIVVLPLAAAAFLHEAAVDLTAAPADYLDTPSALAANADGDVYVGYDTDTLTCFVRRFSPDGDVRAGWLVDVNAEHCNVAEAGDGGVFVSLRHAGVVRHYTRDGIWTRAWPVADLIGPIATDPDYGSGEANVYVLADAPGNQREVRSYSHTGDTLGAFPVADSSFDLTVWPTGAGIEPEVLVAEGARDLDGPPSWCDTVPPAANWVSSRASMREWTSRQMVPDCGWASRGSPWVFASCGRTGATGRWA